MIMKYSLLLFFLQLGFSISGFSQKENTTLFQNDQVIHRNGPTSFNPDWAPFFHGVASGDPLDDRVIIWTRITPDEMNMEPIEVNWRIATDPALESEVQAGTFITDASRDFTVKIDVLGLAPGTTYYYGFTALDKNSLTGKTKTTPTGDEAEQLKFGIVSCSNYQAGYFNAYHRLADRTDLDAIIHLGDYIYEYADGVYGDANLFETRALEPAHEIVNLEEYRTRYSTYRLDTNLIRVHQQHPFIAIWDDHETANDAYVGGAQNHTEATEGSWEARKSAAKQAYFEWLPVRENEDQRVYRNISYGNLMDLILLDTRLEGRQQQVASINAPELQDTNRTILGSQQKAWLYDQLLSSTAQWKVIGQQVIFSEYNVGWAAVVDQSQTYESLENLFLDIWDGYPAERAEVVAFLDSNQLDNVVIVTGDFHSAYAFDVAVPANHTELQQFPEIGTVPFYTQSDYNPETGEGAVAVEFATPSITSANFDENIGNFLAQVFQQQINTNLTIGEEEIGNPNPHLKYAQLVNHGYFILDVQAGQAQADWYFSQIRQPASTETYGEGWLSNDGENHLVQATMPSTPKPTQDEPAPNDPPMITSTESFKAASSFVLLGLYPNPFKDQNTLHYSLATSAAIHIGLYNSTGKKIKDVLDEKLQAGVYSLRLNTEGLSKGSYFYQIYINGKLAVTANAVKM